jgi:hypothetical protein
VTVEEGQAPVGIETPRHWSDLATRRSTPLRCGLSNLVAFCGQALHPDGQIPVAHAAWSRTQTATFRDVRAVVRRHLWDQGTFCTSLTDPAWCSYPARLSSGCLTPCVLALDMYKVKLRY